MASSFSVGIRDVIKELEGVRDNLTLAYQTTLYDIGKSLVHFTPIKTGLASSNWNVTPEGRSDTMRAAVLNNGESSISSISYQVQGIQAGQRSLFYNPTHYIDDLEDGTSRQAPAGMVKPTLSIVQDIWLENINKVYN